MTCLTLVSDIKPNTIRSNPTRPIEERVSGIPMKPEDNDQTARRPVKRLSSPEKWEAQQLIASGPFPPFQS